MNVLERLSLVSKITELLESAKEAKPLQRLSIMPKIFDLFSELGVKMGGDNASGTATIPDLEFDAPNKNAQVGIDGINGVHHANIDTDEYKDQLVVYSNTKNGIICSFDVYKLADNGKVNYKDANIHNDPKYGNFNVGKTENSRANKKTAFDYVVTKDVFDRAVKIAELSVKVANNIFPLTYKNYTLEPAAAGNGICFVTDGEYEAIYENGINNFVGDVDSGFIPKLINDTKIEKDKEYAEHDQKFKDKLALGNVATTFVTDDQFKLIDSWESNDLVYNKETKDYEYNTQLAKDIVDTLKVYNDKKLKLTQDQVDIVNNVLSDIRRHLGVKFSQSGTNSVAENKSLIVNAKSSEQTTDTDITDRLNDLGATVSISNGQKIYSLSGDKVNDIISLKKIGDSHGYRYELNGETLLKSEYHEFTAEAAGKSAITYNVNTDKFSSDNHVPEKTLKMALAIINDKNYQRTETGSDSVKTVLFETTNGNITTLEKNQDGEIVFKPKKGVEFTLSKPYQLVLQTINGKAINGLVYDRGAGVNRGFVGVKVDHLKTVNDFINSNDEVDTTNDSGNENNALFEKYKAGGFNDESATDFKQTMHNVSDQGLPFDSLKDGVVNWFTANQDQILA